MVKEKILIITIIILMILMLFADRHQITYNKSINSYYSEYIKTKDKTKLYIIQGDKAEKIGYLESGIILNVEKYKNAYFKLKNTNYIINYDTTEKSDKVNDLTKYNILYKITKPIIETKYFKIKNIELNVIKDNEKSYEISFFGNRLEIPKENYSEIKKEKPIYINKIPVLNITGITEDYLKIVLDKLKEQKYETINMIDFEDSIQEKISLKNKSVLIINNHKTKELNKLFKEYGFIYEIREDFNITNSVATKKRNRNSYDIMNIKKERLDEVLEGKIIFDGESAQQVPVLNYHFFFDPQNKDEVNGCGETICLDKNELEKHLKYLKDNNYRTLSIDEYTDWYEGKLEVPKKSILITIDDGAMGTSRINGNHLINLLEKYKLNATLYLITAWWDINNYKSYFLDVETHGYDIHFHVNCPNKKPRAFCLTDEELREDLKKSLEIVKSNHSFAYPFYAQNERYRRVLNEVGIKVAFVGGNRPSTRQDNRYLLPRYPIYIDITLERFINMINGA